MPYREYSWSYRHLDVHVCKCLDLLGREALSDVFQEPFAVPPPQHGEVRHHDIHAVDACKRIVRPADELGAVLAVAMLHQDDQLLLAGDEVHRAADTTQ